METERVKAILKNSKILIPLDIKIYYKAIAIKTNRVMESEPRNTHTYMIN